MELYKVVVDTIGVCVVAGQSRQRRGFRQGSRAPHELFAVEQTRSEFHGSLIRMSRRWRQDWEYFQCTLAPHLITVIGL